MRKNQTSIIIHYSRKRLDYTQCSDNQPFLLQSFNTNHDAELLVEVVHNDNSIGNMLFDDGVPDEDYIDYLLLKDYEIKKTELKEINGQSFILTSFTGKHDNEYTISEAVNGEVSGRVQLLKRGIIQLSWVIKQEERTGVVSV